MLQRTIWYIFNDVLSHRKASSLFTLTPEVNRSNHPSHATEVPTTIDLINITKIQLLNFEDDKFYGCSINQYIQVQTSKKFNC